MRALPVRMLESAVTTASQVGRRLFRGTARVAESATSLTDTATRNAAEAAEQVSDAAAHRDRACRDADALIKRRS